MRCLLADTGVQLLCYPMPPEIDVAPEIVPGDWQSCRYRPHGGNEVMEIPYIQWRMIPGRTTRLFLAVDTTLGRQDEGHFCDRSGFVAGHRVRLTHLLSDDDRQWPLPEVEFSIDPPTVGDVKDVDLIVDFGNSRTGILLLEMRGETSPTPQMLPFRLIDRGLLSAWNDRGEFDPAAAETWFSARTHWSETPFAAPPPMHRERYREVEGKSGWLGRSKTETIRESESITPRLFEDLSMVRLGKQAGRIAASDQVATDYRSGVSSPKRYLWAADDSWLEGGNWFMSLRETAPTDRPPNGSTFKRLSGQLLRFIGETDDDGVLRAGGGVEGGFDTSPPKPRHAPRAMMTAAMYELLCQAFAYVNSVAYRSATGQASRPRRLRSVTLTYPTGMLVVERDRLLKQATKAAKIFAATAGRVHREPAVELGVDEASAVGLAYAWGELTALGRDPRLWLSLAGSPHVKSETEPSEELSDVNALTVACIDIGGGTSDLMITRYTCDSSVDDVLTGTIIHRDGISIAGDQLVKRLLERIIVPRFAERVGLTSATTQVLFGPEVPRNRSLRGLRLAWMNGIFVPLAVRYLESAVSGEPVPISHTDQTVVRRELLDSLAEQLRVFEPQRGWNLHHDLQLSVRHEEFEDIVGEVFGDLVKDFCGHIVEHQADLVLLAGQPTKLDAIQSLVRRLLPLPPTRVIAMHRHYAGNWYPYQAPDGRRPGVIHDPKSTVVVGAAIDFLARHGHLPQFHFRTNDSLQSQPYYWGVMTDAVSGIRKERLLFDPDNDCRIQRFTTTSQRVLIGRKFSGREDAEASPVYLLKAVVEDRLAPIELEVELERSTDEVFGEEQLRVLAVEGTVAGKPARLGHNVFFSLRTLADEHYYLDSGGLDNIDLS